MKTSQPAQPATQGEPGDQPQTRGVRKWSMIWSFSLYMVGVVVVTLLLTAVVVNGLMRDSLTRDQQNMLAERVYEQAELVRGFRDEQLQALRGLATDPYFPATGCLTCADRYQELAYLEEAVLKTGRFEALGVANRQGQFPATTDKQWQGLDFPSMPWFEEARGGSTGISHLQLLTEDGAPGFFFYTPLGTATGEPELILVGWLPAAELWKQVDPVKVSKSGYGYMADDHAVLMAHGARDAKTGQPTHALVFYAINTLDDPLIQAANAQALYGAKQIDKTAQIPSLANFITSKPPVYTPGNPTPNIHRYYFPQQKANKTSVVIPIGAPADLGMPCAIGPNDWVFGITVTDADFLAPLTRLRQALLAVSLLGILLGGAVGVLAAISISRPSRQLADLARQVQSGNYSARSPIRAADEIGQLATAMNAMLDRLSEAMQVQQAQIQTLLHTGDEAAQGAVSLSAAAEEMAAATEELNTSSEQVVQAVQAMSHDAGIQMNQVQQTAQQIHSLDQEIGRVAGLSNELNQSAGQMRTLAGQAEQAIQQTHSLSQQVQTVLHLIEKFGRQTNMLALNATIEAARAGEMGASFVVVAEEVRRLAESSEQALQQIDALNTSIQESINTIQVAVGQTGQAILRVSDMAAELSTTATRQAQTSGGLVEITNQLAAIAETNAAGAEEIASSIEQQSSAFGEISSSSHELAILAQKLQTLANQLVGAQQPENGRKE